MVGARPRSLFPIILVSLASTAWSQGFDGPARALAQKISAALKAREAVVFSFNIAAVVGQSDASAAREAISRELPSAGIVSNPQAAISLAVTLSQNLRDWVGEIRHGDIREVVMEHWPKLEETGGSASLVIEKRRMI